MGISLLSLVRISRPRFWLYAFGTLLIGCLAGLAAGGSSTPLWPLLFFGAYFLFPANLLIYGINDVFDYETDLKNPKKQGFEPVLPKSEHTAVLRSVIVSTAPFLIGALFISLPAFLAFMAYITFATFYSLPPLRAKARPFLDSIFSGGHYVATGVFGWYLVAPEAALNWWFVVAAMSWTIAMHAYCAVPDIKADKASGLSTIATVLGPRSTLYLCALLYLTSFSIVATIELLPFVVLAVPHIFLVYMTLAGGRSKLLSIYKRFVVLNGLTGGLLILYLLSLLTMQ